ncbi:energy transducer TonB [Caulobacter sp. UNC358MFTsu5.1]|uniref:energy transducer TonB n=1 Tax=Caulobacter sp. UNC358MFTsu5.1 TaxID=1449049 RepID=UPI0004A70E92|nr:energy transducer TonB [Caulobacter sp. UNC358MFTsu5.1]
MILPFILALQAAPAAMASPVPASTQAPLGAQEVKINTGKFRADQYYPDYAQRMGVSDVVEATCKIGGHGALEGCSVGAPRTDGYGFDQAAAKLLAASRVAARVKSGESIEGRTLHLTIRFTSRSYSSFSVRFE